MLRADDLRKRLAALEVWRSLAKEKAVIRLADDPLLPAERRHDLCALDEAAFGVEAARLILARALVRLQKGEADGVG
jgi:hypothetical protein